MTDRQRHILGWLTGAGLVVSGASIGLNHWANTPASSSGVAQMVQEVEGATTAPTYAAFEGTQFVTDLPTRLSIKSSRDVANGPILTQMLLAASGGTPGSQIAEQLAITIGNVPAEGLSGVSAVSLREHSAAYTEQNFDWLPTGARAFTGSQGGYEMSVFFADDSRYAALVVTGSPNDAAALEAGLAHSVATWRWK